MKTAFEDVMAVKLSGEQLKRAMFVQQFTKYDIVDSIVIATLYCDFGDEVHLKTLSKRINMHGEDVRAKLNVLRSRLDNQQTLDEGVTYGQQLCKAMNCKPFDFKDV